MVGAYRRSSCVRDTLHIIIHKRIRLVNNELVANRCEISIYLRLDRIARHCSFLPRRSFFMRKEKKERTSHEGFSRVGEEGPSRTRKSAAENYRHYGRRRNSRDVAAIKNCIFSCQKIGGGKLEDGEREGKREKPRRRPPSSHWLILSSSTYRLPFGSFGAD